MSVLETIDTLIFIFFMEWQTNSVKRETIKASIVNGGLRMPDNCAFHTAEKVMTMKNLIVENGKYLNLFLTITDIKNSC